MGGGGTSLRLFGYLAAGRQYRYHHHHVSHGVPGSEHAKPRRARASSQARRVAAQRQAGAQQTDRFGKLLGRRDRANRAPISGAARTGKAVRQSGEPEQIRTGLKPARRRLPARSPGPRARPLNENPRRRRLRTIDAAGPNAPAAEGRGLAVALLLACSSVRPTRPLRLSRGFAPWI